MFQEHRSPWDFTSIRRCFRVPNWTYLEAISLGHTVYFAFYPGLKPALDGGQCSLFTWASAQPNQRFHELAVTPNNVHCFTELMLFG